MALFAYLCVFMYECTCVVVGDAEQRGQECVSSNPTEGQKML